MQYRLLTPGDTARYQALRLDALRDAPTAFGSSYEEERGFERSKIEGRLSNAGGSGVFGAFDGEELVATAGLLRHMRPKMSHRGEIWGVYTAPGARGKGHARRVMEMTLAQARDACQLHHVSLGVNTSNTAAIALYRSLGFEEIGVERVFMIVDDEPQDEMMMVCELG